MTPSRFGRALLVVGWLAMALASAGACSNDRPLPAGRWGTDDGGSGGGGGVLLGPCDDGDVRPCHREIAKHGSIVWCYEGTQRCEHGKWGACGDGSASVKNVPLPPDVGPGSSTQAQSSPSSCAGDPCNPYCQQYQDDPDADLKVDGGGTPIYTWQGGSLNGFPVGLVKKGLKEPCGSAYDCQFNSHCVEPLTGSSCVHSKCQVGIGLSASCDACVADICAASPGCCSASFPAALAHSPCVTGTPLKTGVDSCVDSICASQPACCKKQSSGGWWGQGCVSAVASTCGKSCIGTWDQSCVNKVASVCGATCGTPGPSSCAHSVCQVGSKLSMSCNPCVADICSVIPSCCSGTWSSTCVNAVASECGLSCPLTMQSPPPESGECKPWLPGQADPGCTGVNLTAGPACDGKVPVCNVGTQAAPAGVRVIHFPANSSQYPKCAPDQSHPQTKTCGPTTQPIPPGQCVTVDCPTLTNGNREIMVNPPGVGQLAECSCKDNWSLYSGNTTCGPPACAADVASAAVKKVNMLLTVDRSGSMSGGKWTGTKAALNAFFGSPSSAGLGVALEFWSTGASAATGDGCGNNCSDSTNCANPMVPLGTLSASAAPTDAHEQALKNGLATMTPSGMTPTYPALEGALLWASNNLQTDPNNIYVVVLVTDGDPTQCQTNVTAISALAASAYLTYGVRTYVIGMQGATIANLNAISNAGGTGNALVISGTNSNSVETQLVTALTNIAKENATCSLALPAAGLFDPNDVTVTFTPSAGGTVLLPQRWDLAACGSSGGWTFDNNSAPTKVELCPSSCASAQQDPGGKISFNVGCPKNASSMTHVEQYQAKCPSGTKPVWGLLTWNASTPGGSSVSFRARTAPTNGGLASAGWHDLGAAQASPNTQSCALGGPAPLCPVDVYSKLGSPDQQHEWLELAIDLTPAGASSPMVDQWKLSYSCPPGE